MGDIEPRRRRVSKQTAPRHIPQVVVPIPIDEVRDFMRAALTGTSIVDPIASTMNAWFAFTPYVRFTSVDPTHTLIELDVVGTVRGAEVVLFQQRRGEIDRFFVAIQDELDRRDRWRPRPPSEAYPELLGPDGRDE